MRSWDFGQILLWYGILEDLPDGYRLCNGQAQTPDLRNLFVVGAGGAYAVNQDNNNPSNVHDFTGDLHHHHITAGERLNIGFGFEPNTDDVQINGTTDSEINLPPYHGLYYVMYRRPS